jgi:arylformamidase
VDNTSHSPVSRRAVLGGAVAALAGALALNRRLFAQALQTHLPPGVAPGPKGPIVFLDYDQAELDASYDQAPWAPNRPEIDRRNAQKSRAAVARLGAPRRLAYGPTEIEKLDLYAARRPNAPMNVFIHGGAWRAGRAADVAYKSETFVEAGAHFIALDFNNVVETKGDLSVMADQVRRAVAWVYKNAASFDADPGQLYVSGTSSGAHLAGVVLTTDWPRDFGLPANIVKGGLLCSGMYDLYPVSLSARSGYVRFTPGVIEALSSQRHLERLVAPVIIAYGTRETPEFQRQSREFAAAVKAAGKAVTLLVGEGYNHFEIQETLGNPYGLLGRAALAQMRLNRA